MRADLQFEEMTPCGERAGWGQCRRCRGNGQSQQRAGAEEAVRRVGARGGVEDDRSGAEEAVSVMQRSTEQICGDGGVRCGGCGRRAARTGMSQSFDVDGEALR